MEYPSVDDMTIRQAQSGDASAFERLLELIYDMIFAFAFKWAGDRRNAEDITQQVCLKLARTIQQFRFESAFSSWLYRVVINCAKDWWRSEKRNIHEPYSTAVLGNSSSAIVSNSEQAMSYSQESDFTNPSSFDKAASTQIELRQTLHLIETFGQDYKETVLLVHAEGMSHKQAAEILQVKESTISWRLHDIRKRLAKIDEQTSKHTPNTLNSDEKGKRI